MEPIKDLSSKKMLAIKIYIVLTSITLGIIVHFFILN